MPYKTVSELPESVKHSLPKHAQEIYIAAFNHAWENYKNPAKRHGNESREEVSHKVAWSAVEKKYIKTCDAWKER